MPERTPARRLLLVFALAMAFGTMGFAQQIFLQEDFSSGVPAAGWTVTNNGVSIGWEDGGGFALHQDWFGSNDNSLRTPTLDLSTATEAWLHFGYSTQFAAFGTSQNIEISTDGGLTFTVAEDLLLLGEQISRTHTIDLSSYAGLASVMVSFRYQGDNGSRWSLDDVTLSDSSVAPSPPPVSWSVNLPSSFAQAPFFDGFEGHAGVLPPTMAVTCVDAVSGLPDPEAWCNIGQQGPCVGGTSGIGPADGAFSLEMGLDPSSTNFHFVRNALVYGINAAGLESPILDLEYLDFGEEYHAFDGLWISQNGSDWYRLLRWDDLGDGVWTLLRATPLDSTPVDPANNFYLMFAQEDNFPFADLDGIAFDNLDIGNGGSVNGLHLEVQNLIAGQIATFLIDGARKQSAILIAYSIFGPGPSTTAYGVMDLSNPIQELPSALFADAFGEASMTVPVSYGALHRSVYLQAVETRFDGSNLLSNPLAERVR